MGSAVQIVGFTRILIDNKKDIPYSLAGDNPRNTADDEQHLRDKLQGQDVNVFDLRAGINASAKWPETEGSESAISTRDHVAHDSLDRFL